MMLQGQNKLDNLHQQISNKYIYQKSRPLQSRTNYYIFKGIMKQLNIPVTIKITINPEDQLGRYLNKLKSSKVENTIKIYEIIEVFNCLCLITEEVTFSNLQTAIIKYKKLDQNQAIFIFKIILSTHVDLLRAGINWYGTEQDIEFTDNGIKLSWNNSMPFNKQNPFPQIFDRITGKAQKNEGSFLPFIKNKILQDLKTICTLSASEISLNPNMKKRQKMVKKKGKNWICLKQTKNDFEYYEQRVIFGVHKQIGFCRIKIYEQGNVDLNILQLNKTKNTFTRVIDYYKQLDKVYIVSQYSNGGTLSNYAIKLKVNGVTLKQEQIQFFFYSLFEPLKIIQESSIKSLSMLHIKNIYIQNGILKIGQPIPMNQQIINNLKDKCQVPDFYSNQFKKNPLVKNNTYDTYSLGVLIYKLMFTQYPIFPKNEVHIPPTPTYSKRLKKTLQIFLNQGGLLKDLQKKIQVSQSVTKQVKQNKNILLSQKQKDKRTKKRKQSRTVATKDDLIQLQDNNSQRTQFNKIQQNQQQDEQCCKLCCAQLQDPVKHRSIMLQTLQQSPYSLYRLITKLILVLSLYIFVYYFSFIQSSLNLLSDFSSFQKLNVTISTINYEILVSNPDIFYKTFNTTDRSLTTLTNLGCFINNNSTNTSMNYSKITQSSFMVYTIFGIITMIILLIFKACQIMKFDIIKTLYNMSTLRANFNMSNYIIFNLFFTSLINDHYIFFHQIFNTTHPTCEGTSYYLPYGSTYYYYSNQNQFVQVFVIVFIIHFILIFLNLIMIVKTQKIRYTRLFNPIFIFLPFLIGYQLIARIGVLTSYYYPRYVYGNMFTYSSYINFIGVLPQILFLFQFLLQFIVDWTFWFIFDKKRRMLINDISTANLVI